ncbi:MAG: hypothetical protein K6E27_05040 [Eubacterium sp.]|nr:hypothetical protein [Eubacterium sp.]
MNLVIHDLSEQEWQKVADKYNGWEVISDDGSIKPCVGCFGCWVKTPGECVIKDKYNRMGALIHHADEVVVITRYSYGCFSSFVKNVFDRSIGWVLPYFEKVNGEMHHKMRYQETKTVTFIFRAESFNDEDKEKAKSYVEAVCRNFRCTIKDIRFENESVGVKAEPTHNESKCERVESTHSGKTILLNGSLRGNYANTLKFLNYLNARLDGKAEVINLSNYMFKQDELVKILLSAENIVLGMPLYVDGVPGHVLRIMEKIEDCEIIERTSKKKRIYVVSNMGFYESVQLKNLMSQVKTWSEACGYEYGGGVAIGAGEMLNNFVDPKSSGKGPGKNVTNGLDELAGNIMSTNNQEDIYAECNGFPRSLYMMAANSSWPLDAKKNGLKKKDLLRQL